MFVADLPTPQVLIDRPRLMRNIDRAQQLASAAGVGLRPHAKTHKSPIVARWQLPERWCFVAEVPKTSVGKFSKRQMREAYLRGDYEVIEVR